ncbi:beta-lactamase family protein [Mycolicibacterium sp. S2-37]|uniref:serine hydrolase domain-containing protein n=1 Tax=Mycolicibacterium sp. S2-37 TaxID=2810297 RepID=UPI001A9464F2|nr:serine hydrolase domain-containing protein [Mycolicibacterium sp. S2-37]MBO0679111.1 beta-lactamase family protein [Mycolicibacterium sp. S2-37]
MRITALAVALALVAVGCSHEAAPALHTDAPATQLSVPPPAVRPLPPPLPRVDAGPEFAPISDLMNAAIAAHRLPGAVVLIGHGGDIVFRQAYGDRKVAGAPGLDGKPAPAEPMTEDTIFDLASLTKPLATATAVMQLYEQGRVDVDEPVQKYLPAFNPANEPERAEVTVRMLLTHTSGEHPDVELRDPWGLAKPDRAEGFRRALTNPLFSRPGEEFRYSDINFTVLGALLEAVTGEREDEYVQRNIFGPLGMTDTGYLPDTDLLSRIAPTEHDVEGRADPRTNPNFDKLIRGAVHDTTTRRMGGVAGHAGVFATAQDVSVFAQALLDRLANRPSSFPLRRETLELMVTPQQPGHTAEQVPAANAATRAAPPNPKDPLLAARYPAIPGQNLRGFGWDIDTSYSQARGMVFPIGSFGHTGFTGTSVWIDPASDSYVILLANAIHPRGNYPINELRGDVATVAARALGL